MEKVLVFGEKVKKIMPVMFFNRNTVMCKVVANKCSESLVIGQISITKQIDAAALQMTQS